ncbi:MAG TPA: hypothetical protein VI306_08445 [Pyrinomonadaceae bacterium]
MKREIDGANQPLKRLAKFNRRYATPRKLGCVIQPLKRLVKFNRRYATPRNYGA